MAITAASTPPTAPAAANAVLKERSGLTRMLDKGRDEQYNVFMKMFLAQVKNQSIDNPMSTHEMTQSVMSFFQTAEQAQTNKLLKQGNDLKVREQLSMAKSYLNKTVEYEGDTLGFEGKSEKIRFHMPADIEKAELRIHDDKGKLIMSYPLKTMPGEAVFQWDGNNDVFSYEKVPNGQYIVGIVALDKTKQAVDIPTILSGQVRQIRYEDEHDEFLLMVNDTPVELSDVLSVSKNQSTEFIELGKKYEEVVNLLKKQYQQEQVPPNVNMTQDNTVINDIGKETAEELKTQAESEMVLPQTQDSNNIV